MKIDLRINYNDSTTVKIIKLIYLIPFTILMYVPTVIFVGIAEIGNPFSGILFIFRVNKEKREATP